MSLLNLNHLKNKYSLEVKQIAHIGAHKGQEVEDYKKNFLYSFNLSYKFFIYLRNIIWKFRNNNG